MKKIFSFILCVALVGGSAIQAAQSPKKPYKKQNVKAASRPVHKPRPAAKPIAKTDKELLREQIKTLSENKYTARILNHQRELKDFCYKNLCPIKNWTKQDQINTAIWIRKAYAIVKKGPDKKYNDMPTPLNILSAILNNLFIKSPFYLNLSDEERAYGRPGDYTEIFVVDNMTTDLKGVQPAHFSFTEYD